MDQQELHDLAHDLHGQITQLAERQNPPPGVQAAPFNAQEFVKNVLRVANLAAPMVPGVEGELLNAILPILSKRFES